MGAQAKVLGLVVVLAAACRSGGEGDSAPASPVEGPVRRLVATCSSLEGEVLVRRVGQPFWEPAQVGTALNEGDWVRTLSNSTARIQFVHGPALQVAESSTAVVTLSGSGGSDEEPVVAVNAGMVEGTLAESTGESSLPVIFRSPDGSQFRLSGQGQSGFEVHASEGAAVVTVRKGVVFLGSGPSRAEVKAGQAAELGAGGEIRVRMLPPFPESLAPGVDARVRCESGSALTLRWKPVEEAKSYRVQVAKDLSFKQLLAEQWVTGTSFRFKPEGEALFAWRVASRDALGLRGEHGFARRVFCEPEEPREQLLAPAADKVVKTLLPEATVRFAWKPTAGKASYRLVVASCQDLQTAPLRTLETRQPNIAVRLPPGDYYWGVYGEGEPARPLFLAPRKLSVQGAHKPTLNVPASLKDWGK